MKHDVYNLQLCGTFAACVFWRRFHLCPPPGSGLNDGQWHAIRLVAKENFAMLTIDSEEASAVRSTSPLTIATGGTYHLGGKGQSNNLTTDLTKTTHPSLPPPFIVIPSHSSPVPIREARDASEYNMFTTLTEVRMLWEMGHCQKIASTLHPFSRPWLLVSEILQNNVMHLQFLVVVLS